MLGGASCRTAHCAKACQPHSQPVQLTCGMHERLAAYEHVQHTMQSEPHGTAHVGSQASSTRHVWPSSRCLTPRRLPACAPSATNSSFTRPARTKLCACMQWLAAIAASSHVILSRSQPECVGTRGFEDYTSVLFACFAILSALDGLCIWEGLKGA